MTKTLARAAPRKGFWVAVLPFEYTGSMAPAAGLIEEIAAGLSASHTFV